MTIKTIVEAYLDAFFGEQIDYETIRTLLTDDFQFKGPLMTAESATDFIQKLKGFGENAKMEADIQLILAHDETVVARFDFIIPAGRVPASEWYTIKDNKISTMHLICDPRPFFNTIEQG